MADKVYVEGGILVNTPYLKYKDAVALVTEAPEGAIVIPINVEDKNGKYLLIDDKHPQSIFDEYFAQTWFTATTIGTPIFHVTLTDAYEQFHKSISEYKLLLDEELSDESNVQTMLKLIHIGVVASLDTFVLDCILSKVLNDEASFKSFVTTILGKKNVNAKRSRNERIMWEHKMIDRIIKKSYSNIETINRVFDLMYNVSLTDQDKSVETHIFNRHLIAHRNGRKKDGSIVNISKSEINAIICNISDFVDQIFNKIKNV